MRNTSRIAIALSVVLLLAACGETGSGAETTATPTTTMAATTTTTAAPTTTTSEASSNEYEEMSANVKENVDRLCTSLTANAGEPIGTQIIWTGTLPYIFRAGEAGPTLGAFADRAEAAGDDMRTVRDGVSYYYQTETSRAFFADVAQACIDIGWPG